jgi:hypothetical protein
VVPEDRPRRSRRAALRPVCPEGSVEELFRDHKGLRNGQALRHTKITHADRFDRSLLIVALA